MPVTLICPVCHNPFPCGLKRSTQWRQNFCSLKCRASVINPNPQCAVPFEQRFWAKVNCDTCLGASCGCHRGIGHCWPWMGGRSSRGYGQIHGDRKPLKAHRVAFMLTNPIMLPQEIHILHKCDNPPCCRYEHLFLGTHTDNMRDAELKGRRNHRKGEQHWKAKITEQQVMIIRAVRGYFSQQEIGNVFGIRQNHVSAIQLNVQRKEVTEHITLAVALNLYYQRRGY